MKSGSRTSVASQSVSTRTLVSSVVPFVLAALAVLLSRTAAAGDLDGKWKQGPLREEFTVQRWVESACGPPPVTTATGGGETITIGTEGDELSLIGGGRVFKSSQCYDALPTLVRDMHSRDPSGKVWRTHCSTPPNDPRRATMNTLLQVTGDHHIELVETGRYEIAQGQGASCIADVKRTRAFDRAGAAPAPTATAVPGPTAPRPSCTSPGEPARLEVRPSRKLLRTGESFVFTALVLDANGCATSTATAWKAPSDGKGLTVDDHGRVVVDAEAPEGAVEIEVTAAGKTARVTVDVSSPSHYDTLLQNSGLNPSGETDTASVVVIAEGTIGGVDVRAEGDARKRRTIFLIVVGVLTLLVGAMGVFGWRRSRRAAELHKRAQERHEARVREHEDAQAARRAQHDEQQRAHEESKQKRAQAAANAAAGASRVGTVCPSCRREFPPDGSYCPHDGNRLVPLNVGAVPKLGVVCPTCNRGFDAGVRTCPADGTELVPYAMHASVPKPAAPKLRKICPTCGAHFEGAAGFCGKDGTVLVPLN